MIGGIPLLTFLGEYRPSAIAQGGARKKKKAACGGRILENQGVAVGPRPFDNLSVPAAVTIKNNFSKIKQVILWNQKKSIFAATVSTTLQDVSPANQGGTFVY